MASEDSDGLTASDLITYIGVPLTLIGLLPIAYNVVVTLIHQHKIKRVLRRNGMAAFARIHSDIFNRVVEVEFPKYFIQSPQDYSVTELEDRSIEPSGIPLMSLVPGPSRSREEPLQHIKQSDIPGGSWSFLEWEQRQIRSKTQRTQPGDRLRQPQAQIRFWDLILRLYQLDGRVTVHGKGWHELYINPLWTRGHPLMTLVDRQKSSLTLRVASYRDSDGPISLEFVRDGPKRDWSSLQRDESGTCTPGSIDLSYYAHRHHKTQETDDGLATSPGSIVCRVTNAGAVVSARHTGGESFNIDHLRIDHGPNHQGVWFASCAMVLYAQCPTPILDYTVPDNIRRLAKAEIVPRGVVDILYGVGVEERITMRYLSERKYLNDQAIPTNEHAQREMESQYLYATQYAVSGHRS